MKLDNDLYIIKAGEEEKIRKEASSETANLETRKREKFKYSISDTNKDGPDPPKVLCFEEEVLFPTNLQQPSYAWYRFGGKYGALEAGKISTIFSIEELSRAHSGHKYYIMKNQHNKDLLPLSLHH